MVITRQLAREARAASPGIPLASRMEERYVAQLKAEFDSCDATATGYLDKDELTELCHKLHLQAHLHLLLDSLLGDSLYARVNFEEFKDGFVAVLSRSLDLSTSDDESSYLDPVVPEEVKPKFVKGAKRYGRRTRPDTPLDGDQTCDPEAQNPPASSPTAARRPKLPRSTSLESVESLKSEEDGVQEVREEEAGGGGALEEEAESPMCDALETSQHNTQVHTLYYTNIHTIITTQHTSHTPISSSTPIRPPHLQRDTHKAVRSSSPSLLSVSVGLQVLSCLDDGSGSTSPDRLLALWTEEGVRNGRDILQVSTGLGTLDFSLEECVSLCDLRSALDNEMLASRNTVHHAALVSYRYEIQHLQVQVDQVSRERDKVRGDLEQADRRNLQLVSEVDDRHAAMETLNHSKIRDLEQDFRDRLTVLRSQSEQESEAVQQQVEEERAELRKEVELLRVQESRLQEELHTSTQENRSLGEEVCLLKERFGEAEKSISRLQKELDLVLQDKFVSLDSQSAGLTTDDGDTIRTLQTHCRELQDRNDELSSELLRSQTSGRKSRRSSNDPLWTRPHALNTESDSDEFETKRGVSPLARRKLNQTGDGVSCEDPVSIQTELAMEQLRDKHSQEIHSLRVQLETKVNFYERSLELMRNNMEVERKDISQSFKLEISELEEERSRAEREVLELKDKMEKMEQQKGGAWSTEQERRAQREWAELDQNYAREINHLVQRLSAEKEELGAELKLKMDQEVMLVREEAEEKLSEVKLRHAEVQRQQSAFWETRLLLMEQESQKEKEAQEEVTRRCDQFSSERRRLEERVISLQEEVKTTRCEREESSKLLSKSEHKLEQREAELRRSDRRSSELEARLQEACSQLEENIHFLEAHEEVKHCLTLERSTLEEEKRSLEEERRTLEEEKRSLEEEKRSLEEERSSLEEERRTLEEERSSLEEEKRSLEEERRTLEEERSSLEEEKRSLEEERRTLEEERSSLEEERRTLEEERSSLEEEVALRRSQDGELLQEVPQLKEELDSLQDEEQTLLIRSDLGELQESLRRRSSELDSLRTDRARLVQDLKEQAMAVDSLQLELDGRRSAEEVLREQLKEEREEVASLSEEKSRYLLLADQLSTQIVEMEEEISSLRHHLRDLSVHLNQTANLVLDLRNQLRAKSTGLNQLQDRLAHSQSRLERVEGSSAQLHREVQRLTSRVEEQGRELSSVRDRDQQDAGYAQLERELVETQEELRRVEEASEEEKDRMKQQLLQMEELVEELEVLMVPGGPRRRQVEEGQVEVSCLKEQISSLQQDLLLQENRLEQKTRRLEEQEREHERRREEEEKLHKENARYREEVLELSGRNLQLSGENAELSSRLRGDEGAVRLLRERLEKVTKEQQEESAKVRELEEKEVQKERERLQLLCSWNHERELLERELSSSKDKVGHMVELEEELVSLRLKQQWVDQDKTHLLEEAEHRTQQVEALQAAVCSVDGEVEQLRSQLQSASQERNGHAQEVASQHRKLQDAQHKVEELQARLQHQQEVQRTQEEQQEQTTRSLQEEIRTLRLHNQDLLQRLSAARTQEEEVQRLTQEVQSLQSRHAQLESARTQAEDQVVRSDASRVVLQAQVSQERQEARQEARQEVEVQLHLLQVRLDEQTRRSQRLEEELRAQAQQAGSQLHTHQEQQQEVLAGVQERLQQTEMKMKSLRLLLQDKTQQLQEQVSSSSQSSQLLQDLYLENSQLVRALQVTETRQKNAEKKNFLLEDKVSALNTLIREIVTMALAT
ncbi:unnamed protein product [Merluccius merluccius]